MGIRFRCQACSNKVNVKDFLAGKRGICPKCGVRFTIPQQSEPEFQTAAEEPEPDPTPAPTIAAPVVGTSLSPLPNTAPAYAAPQFPTLQYTAPQQPQPAPFAPALPTPGFQAVPSAGPRDPFADAPAAQWYVRHASGQQYGPAPVPTMQKWLAEGRVPGDGMVWREGWADWQMAALVFPQLSAALVPAARGPVAAPFAPQPGMYPAPAAAAAPAAANDPFAFDTPASAASPASQFIHQRRDNSRMMLIISIVLLFAIALVGGVLIYVLTRPKATGEVVARAGVQIAHCEIQTNTF